MPIKKKMFGTGIHAEEAEVYEYVAEGTRSAQEINDLTIALSRSFRPYTLNGYWAYYIPRAKQLLAECGLPNEAGRYYEANGCWQRWERSDEFDLALLRYCQRPLQEIHNIFEYNPPHILNNYHCITEIAESKFGAYSNEHFAALVVSTANEINIARKWRLKRVVEALTFRMGYIISSLKTKTLAERTWEVGKKTVAGGQKGAEAKHGNHEDRERRRREIGAVVMEGVALGLKLTEARKRAAKKLRVSYSTVRRAQSSQWAMLLSKTVLTCFEHR